jgi:hypothetical protein
MTQIVFHSTSPHSYWKGHIGHGLGLPPFHVKNERIIQSMKVTVAFAVLFGIVGVNHWAGAESVEVIIDGVAQRVESKSLSVISEKGARKGKALGLEAMSDVKKSDKLGVHVQDGPMSSKKGTIHVVWGK